MVSTAIIPIATARTVNVASSQASVAFSFYRRIRSFMNSTDTSSRHRVLGYRLTVQQGSHLDLDVLPGDPHFIARNRLGCRRPQHLAGRHIEYCAVPRASHFFAVERAFRKRAASMRAGVVDRIVASVHVEDGDLLSGRLDHLSLTEGDVLRSSYLHESCHGLPPLSPASPIPFRYISHTCRFFSHAATTASSICNSFAKRSTARQPASECSMSAFSCSSKNSSSPFDSPKSLPQRSRSRPNQPCFFMMPVP